MVGWWGDGGGVVMFSSISISILPPPLALSLSRYSATSWPGFRSLLLILLYCVGFVVL